MIDNLKVEYIEKAYDDALIKVLKASEGQEQTYVAPKTGNYEISLTGPSSDANSGRIEGTIYLNEGDVLKTYLGPQVPKATGTRDGTDGVDGSGYGDDGIYKAELYLNDELIAVAGGSGSNGNPGTGDGSYITKYQLSTSYTYKCLDCGNQVSSANSYCPKCYGYYIVKNYSCKQCGASSEKHYHYRYNGTGGAAGKATDAGLSKASFGTLGANGNKAYTSGSNEYSAGGKGGDAGSSGASWIDTTLFPNAVMIRGEGFDQSKLYIKYLDESVITNTKSETVTKNQIKAEEGWTNVTGEVKAASGVQTYSQLMYKTSDFERTSSVSSSYVYVLQQNTKEDEEADGKLTARFPEGYTSVMQRYRTYSGYTGSTMAFMTFNGNSLTRGDDKSNSGYGDNDRYNSLPADYTIHVPLKNSTDTLIAKSQYKKGSTSFTSSKSMLVPTEVVASNASIQSMQYFYDDTIDSIFYANSTFDGETEIGVTFYNSEAGEAEYLIDNFKIYYIENGKKLYFPATTESMSDFLTWNTTANVSVEKFTEEKPEPEYTSVVYKKGELVGYDIYYTDYENDPKNETAGKSFWLYAHEPFNDGEHEQAAIIYDGDGNITKICGMDAALAVSNAGIVLATDEAITLEMALEIAIANGTYTLSEYIPKFYVDGRYSVFHWCYDDTSRGTVAGGYPLWDAMSEIAELPFYIEGSANAPWIVNISTTPNPVTEYDYFKLHINVDDTEKDVLSLVTQVYKDKQLIYTHRQKNITYTNNSYPTITTDTLPDFATAGVYEVVCTVRDDTGAGLGTYTFKVISKGKITGTVYHTDQWEQNRVKFNKAKFNATVNKEFTLTEYLAQKAPRKRGTNVFWSGEKFMLSADVASTPTEVTCQIKGTNYITAMKSTGKKNAKNETIYQGSLWSENMVNKWGNKVPEELTFLFVAKYRGGIVKEHEVTVIVDNMIPYWQLHRVF